MPKKETKKPQLNFGISGLIEEDHINSHNKTIIKNKDKKRFERIKRINFEIIA
jgi:hypothetical protein